MFIRIIRSNTSVPYRISCILIFLICSHPLPIQIFFIIFTLEVEFSGES